MTGNIADFLLSRIAEDEASTLSGDCKCEDGEPKRPDCGDRILADCEAKRQIVESARAQVALLPAVEAEGWDVHQARGAAMFARQTLWSLAFPYAGHPDFREEWGA